MSSQQFLLSLLIKTTRRFSDSIKSYCLQGIFRSHLMTALFLPEQSRTMHCLSDLWVFQSILRILCVRRVKYSIVNLLSYSYLGRAGFLGNCWFDFSMGLVFNHVNLLPPGCVMWTSAVNVFHEVLISFLFVSKITLISALYSMQPMISLEYPTLSFLYSMP